MTKALFTSAAIALAATPALPGGYVDAIVEPVIGPGVIVEETSSSSAGILVPLMLLVLIAAAIASRGGNDHAVIGSL